MGKLRWNCHVLAYLPCVGLCVGLFADVPNVAKHTKSGHDCHLPETEMISANANHA